VSLTSFKSSAVKCEFRGGSARAGSQLESTGDGMPLMTRVAGLASSKRARCGRRGGGTSRTRVNSARWMEAVVHGAVVAESIPKGSCGEI
jgi:hypothetical protein